MIYGNNRTFYAYQITLTLLSYFVLIYFDEYPMDLPYITMMLGVLIPYFIRMNFLWKKCTRLIEHEDLNLFKKHKGDNQFNNGQYVFKFWSVSKNEISFIKDDNTRFNLTELRSFSYTVTLLIFASNIGLSVINNMK